MKLILLLAALLLAGCATERRPSANNINNVYIDCTNRAAFERYLETQLRHTDMARIDSDPVERQYYAAIKDRVWSLRATCK